MQRLQLQAGSRYLFWFSLKAALSGRESFQDVYYGEGVAGCLLPVSSAILFRDQNLSTLAKVQSGPEGIDFKKFMSDTEAVEASLSRNIQEFDLLLDVSEKLKVSLTAPNTRSVSVFSDLWIRSTENTNVFNHVETQCDIDAKSNN